MIRNRLSRFLFIAPSLLYVVFFIYVPLIFAIVLSLHTGRGNELHFSGMDNYVQLLHDVTFKEAIKNSLLFVILIVPLVLTLSLCICICLNKIRSERLKDIILIIFYFPCVTSPVVYSLFFKQLVYSDGIVSRILGKLKIPIENGNVLQNTWATRVFIALICVWAWTGLFVLILNAAIQGVDKNIINAARLDGLRTWGVYRKVIFPAIRPPLLISAILAASSAFQLYVEISLITKGGPETSTYTLAFYLYRKTFTYVAEYGYSAAIGIVIFLLTLMIGMLIVVIRWIRTKNE